MSKPISAKCWPSSGESRDKHSSGVLVAVGLCVGAAVAEGMAVWVVVAEGIAAADVDVGGRGVSLSVLMQADRHRIRAKKIIGAFRKDFIE